MRAVIYARYSSDLQSEASIEDQIEICRRYAQSQNWSIVEIYSDAAISGASRFRPGFQKLLGDAGSGRFDVVICEAIDRLGRRLADTADLQDQLSFHKIRLFTPFWDVCSKANQPAGSLTAIAFFRRRMAQKTKSSTMLKC